LFVWVTNFARIMNVANKKTSKSSLNTTNDERRAASNKSVGSALILAVVLTSLLAIVGVLFVMVSRLDKIATSAVSENRNLEQAVDTVIARISQKLVLDVPGVGGQEYYYDYPDVNNAWLACLEPYQFASNDYRWRQISDVYGVLDTNALNVQAEIIEDYQPIIAEDVNADADGDGVADSRWVLVPGMTSSKGKPIYAAIRVVDNGGMLNVNTAYKFDPCSTNVKSIDGSSQTQIDLLSLAERGSTSNPLGKLDDERFGSEPHILDNYIRDVVWRYDIPDGNYTPFDIGDELKLRNRYILNYNKITTRIEELWENVYDGGLEVPRTDRVKFAENSEIGRNYWFYRTYNGSADPNIYDYRHISTIYNMDRIINPRGSELNYGRMVNVNNLNGLDPADVDLLYSVIYAGFYDADFVGVTASQIAAQLAVNLIDSSDTDSEVTPYFNAVDSNMYYGFEQPCVYISELAHSFVEVGEPPTIHRSYAVELYKPYLEDSSPVGWRLVVNGVPINIDEPAWSAAKQFYVIRNEDSYARLGIISSSDADIKDTSDLEFLSGGETIELQRPLPGGGYVTVDLKKVPLPSGGWLEVGTRPQSIERDIQRHKCIRRLWSSNAQIRTSLGRVNDYDSGVEMIQAHPQNRPFINIGEIGMLFVKSAYAQGPNPIGPNDTELTTRLNLVDPNFQHIFNYLTVFDPTVYPWNDPNETRIKGRININTAPWFVLAQLPWVSQRIGQPLNYLLAQNIVDYRDLIGGFGNIGELNKLNKDNEDIIADPFFCIDYYARDGIDQPGFPDLTTEPVGTGVDGAVDDFEERDVIFSRISNLVTVRSDVFTAYILVRIGTNGPQKRVIAILDRSNVYSDEDKVRIVALYPVPDPR